MTEPIPSLHTTAFQNTWFTPDSPVPTRSPFVTGRLPNPREKPLRPGTKGYNRYKQFLDTTLLETSRIHHRRLVVEEEAREKAEKAKKDKEDEERRIRLEEERQRRLAEKKEKKQRAGDAMDLDEEQDSEGDESEFEDVLDANKPSPKDTTTEPQDSQENKPSLASKSALREVLDRLNQCIDLLYISSTPNIMIPYLLALTADLNDYLAGYHPDIPPTLRTLDKIDQCFDSLIQQGALTMTDKVRLKSIIQRTQLHVVQLEEQWEEEGGLEEEDEKEEQERQQHEEEVEKKDVEGDENMDEGEKDSDEDYEEVEWDLEAARVFWRTFRGVGEGLQDGLENSEAPATMGGFEAVCGGVNVAV